MGSVRSVVLRGLLSVSLLLLLAALIDWRTASARLAQGQWEWFAGSVALFAAALLVGALRWHGLLAGAGVRTSRPATVRAYLLGAFANNFLPTSFGGDALRTWVVGNSGRERSRAAASVLVDRASALACLLLLAWGAVIAFPAAVPTSLVAILAALSVTAVVLAALFAPLLRRGDSVDGRRAASVALIREARDALRAYRPQRSLMARALALGLVFQALTVAATWMVARAIELRLSPAVVAVVVPLVLVATLLPVSIAGFGVREGGFVILLGEVGVAPPDAVLLSLLAVSALALANLPGAVALLTNPTPARSAPASVEQSVERSALPPEPQP